MIHQQRDRDKGETDIECSEEGKCVAGLEELQSVHLSLPKSSSLPILHFSSAYDFPLVLFLMTSPNKGSERK